MNTKMTVLNFLIELQTFGTNFQLTNLNDKGNYQLLFITPPGYKWKYNNNREIVAKININNQNYNYNLEHILNLVGEGMVIVGKSTKY